MRAATPPRRSSGHAARYPPSLVYRLKRRALADERLRQRSAADLTVFGRPGSDNNVKNRYNSIIRKRQRESGTPSAPRWSRPICYTQSTQSVSHYHTPSRELMDHTHSLLFFLECMP